MDEGTVGSGAKPEQISFEEVLDTVGPQYWPVVFYWTLEALIHSEGWHCQEEHWRQLTTTNLDAQRELKEILVALMPIDTDAQRLNRHLTPSDAQYHGQPPQTSPIHNET